MKNDLNLLPKEVIEGPNNKKRKDITLIIFILLGIAGLFYLVVYPTYTKITLGTQKSALEKQYDKLANVEISKEIDNYEILKSEIDRDKKLEEIVNKSEMAYKEVFNALESSISKRASIQSIKMNENEQTINISVIATDDRALTDFWYSLRQTKVFESVRPEGIIDVTSEDEAGNKTSIKRCNIELKYIQKG